MAFSGCESSISPARLGRGPRPSRTDWQLLEAKTSRTGEKNMRTARPMGRRAIASCQTNGKQWLSVLGLSSSLLLWVLPDILAIFSVVLECQTSSAWMVHYPCTYPVPRTDYISWIWVHQYFTHPMDIIHLASILQTSPEGSSVLYNYSIIRYFEVVKFLFPILSLVKVQYTLQAPNKCLMS